MTFKPAIWFPIAALLAVFNLGAVAFAGGAIHATTHAVLAVGFGLWAFRLRQQRVRDYLTHLRAYFARSAERRGG